MDLISLIQYLHKINNEEGNIEVKFIDEHTCSPLPLKEDNIWIDYFEETLFIGKSNEDYEKEK